MPTAPSLLLLGEAGAFKLSNTHVFEGGTKESTTKAMHLAGVAKRRDLHTPATTKRTIEPDNPPQGLDPARLTTPYTTVASDRPGGVIYHSNIKETPLKSFKQSKSGIKSAQPTRRCEAYFRQVQLHDLILLFSFAQSQSKTE